MTLLRCKDLSTQFIQGYKFSVLQVFFIDLLDGNEAQLESLMCYLFMVLIRMIILKVKLYSLGKHVGPACTHQRILAHSADSVQSLEKHLDLVLFLSCFKLPDVAIIGS